jgi:hypothetical protein
MKTKIQTLSRSFTGAVCAGAVLLLASRASAQNLFEEDRGSGNIYEFTTNGVKSTFASSLGSLHGAGLAFNSAGDLFVAAGGNIYEFTNNNGTLSTNITTFASGLDSPFGLAFDGSGNLFEGDFV